MGVGYDAKLGCRQFKQSKQQQLKVQLSTSHISKSNYHNSNYNPSI